ncbi:hypothetical protein ACHAWF_004239 [Thalassiosira exigua]
MTLLDYCDGIYESDKEPFEWYQNYEGAKKPFDFRKDCRVLNINIECGNSRVSNGLLGDGGFSEMTNVDFSSIAVNQMKAKYTDQRIGLARFAFAPLKKNGYRQTDLPVHVSHAINSSILYFVRELWALCFAARMREREFNA